MQLRRIALASALLAAVLPTVPSHAAVRLPRACKLITDVEGDGAALVFKSDALDVLGADISSGPKELTAVLHLKSGSVENDPYLKGGVIWNINFTLNTIKYTFHANWDSIFRIDPPSLHGGMTAGNTESNPAATFTRKGNDFIWTVSRAAIPALAKPKQVFYPTSASSGANSLGGDTAFAKNNTKYIDKQPSCLASK